MADEVEQVDMRTRAGRRLVPRKQAGVIKQLGRRLPNQANDDVDGNLLTEAARFERIASLALCLELHGALEKALPSEKGKVIKRAIKLFDNLGFWSEDDREKREVAFCVTCSGLLLLCVDTVLKSIEEWCIFSSTGIVASARRLMTVECLEAAKDAMSGGWKRYEDFVRLFMPDHKCPDTSVFEEDQVFERWNWYLVVGCDRERYYECYVFQTLKDDMITKVKEINERSNHSALKLVERLKRVVEGLDRAVKGLDSESDSEVSSEEEE